MSDPLQTPPDGTQPQAEVQPEPTDLNETEQSLADAQARIEQEAQQLVEPEPPPAQPEPQPQPPAPPAEPQPDFQEKYRQSSREAQNLIAKNNQAQARIEQLTNINITEDELRSLYPDWDQMNDLEKRAFRATALANKKATQAINIALDLQEQRAWEDDFAKVLKANPALAGREEAFKQYCYKPSHKNVSIDTLVKAFLFDFPAQQTPVVQPSNGLERGSGGPRENTGEEYSEEQLSQIRVSDPKRYRQILQNESRKESRRK